MSEIPAQQCRARDDGKSGQYGQTREAQLSLVPRPGKEGDERHQRVPDFAPDLAQAIGRIDREVKRRDHNTGP